MKTYVILHNIRSAHNVGAVFRTADGSGISKLFLTGYTPAPHDRFGRENPEIVKTSLGATQTVSYESGDDIHRLISRLKSAGAEIVAVEQTDKAIPYTEYRPQGDVVYVFGNEVTGVEEDVLKNADVHIEVPMSGTKESLNVSVCAGVILFQSRDRVAR